MAQIADLLKGGATPEEVAAQIKAESSVSEPKQKSLDEINHAMVEQDVSTQKSLASDLQVDYMLGGITDEQYEQIFNALTA